MNFQHKTVLITGGASGIGKIMARKSLERGCKSLLLWDLNLEALEAVSQEFESLGGSVDIYRVDVSKSEEITQAAKQVFEKHGAVDVLINNAGVVFKGYFHENSGFQIEQSLRVNSTGPMLIAKEFLGPMMAKNSGSICNIASSAGLISNPKMAVYAASKWALTGWSDSLRLEMEELKKEVHVTTIMPFFINTGMFDGVKSKLLPILDPEKTSEKIMRAIEKHSGLLALPLPYWFIRLTQGILPAKVYQWVMRDVFGIYDTMNEFKGRTPK
ncbi:SDR family oxidoreductase [Chryseobacterium sp. A321]